MVPKDLTETVTEPRRTGDLLAGQGNGCFQRQGEFRSRLPWDHFFMMGSPSNDSSAPPPFPMDVTAQDVLRLIQQEGIELIDLKFSDLRGQWQHLTIAPSLLDEGVFQEGIPFDGSSIRGWKAIHESDMAVLPDPATAWLDPFHSIKTMSMVGSILEPRSGEPYQRCPRALAGRAMRHLGASGVADRALFGPEPEFFLFDDVRYESGSGGSFYQVDSIEAPWNTGRLEEGGNLAHKLQLNQGYFPVSPATVFRNSAVRCCSPWPHWASRSRNIIMKWE
jgi:glutamine synthetase